MAQKSYIKGIHNTVADAISRLDYDPKLNSINENNHAMHNVSTKDKTHHKWLIFLKVRTVSKQT
jgi:hypothetical protein